MGWGTGNLGGGSGGGLNFKVVGGTTQPGNPTENTIWVNTSEKITSWIFSATEPSPAAAGMVWITTGTASSVEFNALKKNGLQVYPISAKQYVGGAWVDVTAKSYQGGEWVEWIIDLVLLDSDGFYSNFSQQGATGSGSGVTIGDNYFTVKASNNAGGVYTNAWGAFDDKFDLTGYSTLKFTVTSANINTGDLGNQHGALGISTSKSYSGFVASKSFTANGTYTVDITELEGEYYIVASAHYYNISINYTVNYIELLK